MNLIKNILVKLTFIFLFLTPNLALCTQHVLIYRDFGHKGDENQARGIVKAYKQHHKDTKVTEFNLGTENELKTAVQKAISQEKEKPIILAIGEKTVASCADLFPIEGAVTVHVCHMITTHHPQLVGKADFIAAPIHAIGDFAKTAGQTRTKLIQTVGVAHNRQSEEVVRVYHEGKSKLPESKVYLGVILSGDAPTPNGTIQPFTEANAREFARYIAPLIKDRHLLITNGPRTGKHNPTTREEIKTAHRDGSKDFVTEAFLDELMKAEISPKQYTLFDFQFGNNTNDMDLLLGAVRLTNGEMFVAGESTSSISESVDVLPSAAVIVYDTTSMNSVHKAHVESELNAGRIKYLQTGYREVVENKEARNNAAQGRSAAETIASALMP